MRLVDLGVTNNFVLQHTVFFVASSVKTLFFSIFFFLLIYKASTSLLVKAQTYRKFLNNYALLKLYGPGSSFDSAFGAS